MKSCIKIIKCQKIDDSLTSKDKNIKKAVKRDKNKVKNIKKKIRLF